MLNALKYLLCFFIVGFKGVLFFSQAQVLVVTASDPDRPIPNAAIYRILSSNEIQLLGVTNSNGEFTLNRSATDSSLKYLIRANGFQEATYSPFLNGASSPSVITLQPITRDLNEYVVSGQIGTNSTGQSVFPVTVIDSRRIRLQGANILTDLLVQNLNVRISQDQQLGSSLTLRGMSGQNVKILIDGIPQIGRQDGNLDLSQFNLSQVERIEIIEGPMAVNYGTDAMGGIINIITKNNSGSKPFLKVKSYYESVGTYNVDGSGSFRVGQSNWQFNAGRYFFGGWDPQGMVRNPQWKPRTQFFLDAQWNRSIGSRWNLRQTMNLWQQQITMKGATTITPYEAYAFDTYVYGKRLNYSGYLDYKSKHGGDAQIIWGLSYYGQYRNRYFKDMVTLERRLTSASGDQDSTHFYQAMSRGQYQFKPFNNRMNAQVGYDIQTEINRGSLIKNNSQQLSTAAVFGNLEYRPITNLTLRAGARISHNSRFGNPFTPSVNVLYQPNSKWSIRSSWAMGFRAPSLKEMYLDFVDVNHNIHGNDQLRPEKGQTLQSQATYAFSIGRFKAKMDVIGFYSQVHQLITRVLVDPLTQYYMYNNIDFFQSRGCQWQGELKSQRLTLGMGASYTGRQSTLTGITSPMLYSPEANIRISWMAPRIDCWFSAFYKYNGRMQAYALNGANELVINSLSAYSWLDASASRNFLHQKIALTVGVKNIFNITTVNGNLQTGAHSGGATQTSTGYGRSVFTTLTWNL